MDLIIELREAELDEVYGGQISFSNATFNIRQNARGGDSLAAGGNGGSATAGALGIATGGIGGAATSGDGGSGGFNSIEVISD